MHYDLTGKCSGDGRSEGDRSGDQLLLAQAGAESSSITINRRIRLRVSCRRLFSKEEKQKSFKRYCESRRGQGAI